MPVKMKSDDLLVKLELVIHVGHREVDVARARVGVDSEPGFRS
jgi:hypothetical protein